MQSIRINPKLLAFLEDNQELTTDEDPQILIIPPSAKVIDMSAWYSSDLDEWISRPAALQIGGSRATLIVWGE